MIPDAGALYQRMRETRAGEPLTAKVFCVNEAQKAIDGATRKLGLARITHHDLRICSRRFASKAASMFQPYHAGSATKTAVHSL